MKAILILLVFSSCCLSAYSKEIVAYFPEWKVKENPYYVKNIDKSGSAEKITVLNYAFVIPKPDSLGNIIPQFMHPYYDYGQAYTADMSVDGIADDSITQPLRGHFNQLRKLKNKYPHLKILISLGGWEGSTYFSDIALDDESRNNFVEACINIFIKGNLPITNYAGGKGSAAGIFDGFDIDWEFPYRGGYEGIHHNINDITNFTKLLKIFREKLDSLKQGYLLTAAVPARESDFKYFNFYKDQQYLDWYNLMTYDFHGSWDSITNHHTNLLTSPKDIISNSNSESFDKAVKLFNSVCGVSKNKIVPGGAFYGKAWADVDSVNDGLYRSGKNYKYNCDNSFNNFSDFKKLLTNGYKYYWDKYAMAPFLYNSKDSIFWTFDDEKSLALKSRYVDAYNLRGIMFWEISGDDSTGTLVNSLFTGNTQSVELSQSENVNKSFYIKVISPKQSDWINEASNVIIETECINKKIVKVEFFGNGKSLGYCTKQPFNWAWFNVPVGLNNIKIIASDSTGSIASNSIDIFVHEN